MSRMDRLSESRLETDIAYLEQTLQELKASRQMLGGSSIVHFNSQLPGDYDWQGHIPDEGGGHGVKEFLVEATATTMESLWANMDIFIFTGSPPTPYLGDSLFADEIAGNDPFITSVLIVPNDVDDPKMSTCYFTVEGPGGTSAPLLSVKFGVTALDVVTITVTELN